MNGQPIGDAANAYERGIPLSRLDPSDVSGMEPALVGQTLLGKTAQPTKFPYAVAKPDPECVLHTGNYSCCRLSVP